MGYASKQWENAPTNAKDFQDAVGKEIKEKIRQDYDVRGWKYSFKGRNGAGHEASVDVIWRKSGSKNFVIARTVNGDTQEKQFYCNSNIKGATSTIPVAGPLPN